jgi:hypothetical protein
MRIPVSTFVVVAVMIAGSPALCTPANWSVTYHDGITYPGSCFGRDLDMLSHSDTSYTLYVAADDSLLIYSMTSYCDGLELSLEGVWCPDTLAIWYIRAVEVRVIGDTVFALVGGNTSGTVATAWLLDVTDPSDIDEIDYDRMDSTGAVVDIAFYNNSYAAMGATVRVWTLSCALNSNGSVAELSTYSADASGVDFDESKILYTSGYVTPAHYVRAFEDLSDLTLVDSDTIGTLNAALLWYDEHIFVPFTPQAQNYSDLLAFTFDGDEFTRHDSIHTNGWLATSIYDIDESNSFLFLSCGVGAFNITEWFASADTFRDDWLCYSSQGTQGISADNYSTCREVFAVAFNDSLASYDFKHALACQEIECKGEEDGFVDPVKPGHELETSPNPFNPTTSLSFIVSQSTHVRLDIYDILGRRIETLVDGWLPAGEHSVSWDAASQASGVYLARLTVGESSETIRLHLLK